MPTALREGPYRLFFYSGDGSEPPHVHIEREHRVCKFWLDPVRMQTSGGFNRTEIRRIARIVEDYQAALIEAWNDYFDR